jgi:hypothetical protein
MVKVSLVPGAAVRLPTSLFSNTRPAPAHPIAVAFSPRQRGAQLGEGADVHGNRIFLHLPAEMHASVVMLAKDFRLDVSTDGYEGDDHDEQDRAELTRECASASEIRQPAPTQSRVIRFASSMQARRF